ncbi:MAG: AEC family transporter [Clostridia bacterium]|nr:AEC family transporter [Clostridia bacterium]
MSEVINQLITLLSFIIIGYVVRKKNVVDENAASVLSSLLVYVFAPAVNLRSLSENLNRSNVSEKYIYLVAGACILVFTFFGAKLLSKVFSKDRYEQNVYSYNLTTGNYGYFGFALILSLFGEDMLLNTVLFSIPMTVYIYTEGLRILTDKKNVSFKSLINPALISILLGAVIGISGIKLPSVAVGILSGAGGCMAPASMMLTGMALAEYNLLPLLKKTRVYIVSILRLLVIPLSILVVLLALNVSKNIITIAVLFYSLPAGLNTVVFPKMINKDCRIGLSTAMVSNVLCIITIPIVIEILKYFT